MDLHTCKLLSNESFYILILLSPILFTLIKYCCYYSICVLFVSLMLFGKYYGTVYLKQHLNIDNTLFVMLCKIRIFLYNIYTYPFLYIYNTVYHKYKTIFDVDYITIYKKELLDRFSCLEKNGICISKKYTLDSDLEEMISENNKHVKY